jgi:diguanylate cyclase (GGDEF)-like protein
MISLKKYLDLTQDARSVLGPVEIDDADILSSALAAYAAALTAMGACSLEACPGVGKGLKQRLEDLAGKLSGEMSSAELTATGTDAREQLQEWGRHAAWHYMQKTGEVKELLIAMARTAESVGVKDQRCASQIQEVTSRLNEIATLDDVTKMRVSIRTSAAELKSSVDRMTAESQSVVEQLRKQVSHYRTRLEEAEEIASRDALTGVRSRLNVESQIEVRIVADRQFCVAILDINGFKQVNDEFGHVTGDELLKQFATELQSVCRSTDVIGRWGGDEFILLLDCGLADAIQQRERLRDWVCGHYTVQGESGTTKLNLNISIGLAEHRQGESMKELLARADAAMYAEKGVSRIGAGAAVVSR